MAKLFHMDKGRSKNLTASLGLCFYSFFTMFLTLNPSDFWQFPLLIGLIIDNHNNIVSNLDRFVFSEYPNRYPNWVPHLGTQRFQLTPIFPSRVMVLRLSKKVHFLQSVPTSARNLSISQPVFVGLQDMS